MSLQGAKNTHENSPLLDTMDPLVQLRTAILGKKPVQLVVHDAEGQASETASIKEATHVNIDGTPYDLDQLTAFHNEDTQESLRPVIFCWMNESSSIVDYKNACLENGIADFKFLVKAELTTWLNGNSELCKFIKNKASNGTDASEPRKRSISDPQMVRIGEFELESLDHNAALRGSKNLLLKNLISDAKKYTSTLKKSKTNGRTHAASGAQLQKKQPIIIVSPATTALMSLSNIKEFLEEGRFVEPSLQRSENNVVTINHSSPNLVQAAQLIMVVDNVDLFTKPEYWDRVVAIFTTGQAWQFLKFKYSKPEILFQHYHGFFVTYSGGIVPKQISDWNVTAISVDRGDKRFRDKMIVRDLWLQLERILISKGYGVK